MQTYYRQLSTTAHPVVFYVTLSIDHITGATGKTLTLVASKDGGTMNVTPSGAVTELANGAYALAGNATDRGTLGTVLIYVTGSGCDPLMIAVEVVGFDPFASIQPANVTEILGMASQGVAGYVAPDWANINAPTTAVDLTNTTIKTLDNAAPDSTTITAFLSMFEELLGVDPTQFSAHALALAGGGGATPAQIWDYLTSLFATPGSVGELLLGIKASTDAIRVGGVVFVRATVDADGNTFMRQGVDYTGAYALRYTSDSQRDLLAAGVTVRLQFGGVQSFVASSVTGAPGAWVILIPVTASQTAVINRGKYSGELAVFQGTTEVPELASFTVEMAVNP